MEKFVYLNELFDLYGDLLTEKQRDYFMDYYFQNLSYGEIASKYNSTPIRVERNIRHAIEISWNRGDWDLMERLFGHSIDNIKAKPTNSEYLITVAEFIKIEVF